MYKYNEKKILDELKEYVDKTYVQHYSIGNLQSTEFIIDNGHGTGFCVGNIMKYAQRYGKKGTTGDWRKDLFKVAHYTLMQIYIHDLIHGTHDEDDQEEPLNDPYEGYGATAQALTHAFDQEFKRRDDYGLNYRSIDEATASEWRRAAEAYYGDKKS